MKEFLLTYWKELAYALVAILTLLLCIFRKKDKVEVVLDKILQIVPEAICDAEHHFGAGQGIVKKAMVMSVLAKSYKSLTGYELRENSGMWKFISKYVEDVLLTPERKNDEK